MNAKPLLEATRLALRVMAISSLTGAAGKVLACQLAMAPPLTQFDDSLYVFTGTVLEIVGPVRSDQVEGEAWGLRVEPAEITASPGPLSEVVDIFEYNLSPACEAVGLSYESVAARFRTGTEVRVVARQAARLAAPDGALPVRLEAAPFNNPSVLAPIYRDEPTLASVDEAAAVRAAADAGRYDWRWYSGKVTFELLGELSRLQQSGSDGERREILTRISTAPVAHSSQIDFAAMVRLHIRDPQIVDALLTEPR